MNGLIPAVLGATVLIILFVLLTDGRYFGKKGMRWVYDRLGPSIFGTQTEPERWRALARELHLSGGESILDVGTAIGDLPLTLAALPGFYGPIVGIDWSPQMIAQAQRAAQRAAQQAAQRDDLRDRVRFQVVDVREGLPFQEGEFDVVFCLGLLETLPQPGQVLNELRRVLAPQGTMVLSLYRGWSSIGAALSLEWYQEHLSPLGLADLRVVACRRSQDALIARSHDPSP